MVNNIIVAVRKELERLKKEIGQRESELASLKGDLGRHERIYGMLAGDQRRAPRVPVRRRRIRRAKRVSGQVRKAAAVNWDSVLEALPQRFTLADDFRH